MHVRWRLVRMLVVAGLAAQVTLLRPEPSWARDFCPMEPLPDATLRDYEAELLARLNDERTANGLSRLPMDGRAQDMARAHAVRMAATGTSYHNSEYSSPTGGPGGEVVAYGQCSARDVHADFMDSSAHRFTMLVADWSLAGIGVASNEGGLLFVVENFAAPPKQDARPAATAKPRPAPVRSARPHAEANATPAAPAPEPTAARASPEPTARERVLTLEQTSMALARGDEPSAAGARRRPAIVQATAIALLIAASLCATLRGRVALRTSAR